MPKTPLLEGPDELVAATIGLTKGQVALIDKVDLLEVEKYRWNARWSRKGKCYYACTTVYGDGTKRSIQLHRLILGEPPGLDVDHINGNTLDCRRVNLRAVSTAVNSQNRHHLNRDNTTGYRGVCPRIRKGKKNKYAVTVRAFGKAYWGGYFPYTPEGLLLAADKAQSMRDELHQEAKCD